MLQYFSQSKQSTQVKYTPEDFLFRWKKLQRVIDKEGYEALLLITGLDGADHPQTSYLFNWLFLGLSGNAVYTNRYLDPMFSQTIVLISSKQSFIFTTPDARKQLDHLIYTIQNCTVFCPTEAEYASKDQFDILKIASFYQALTSIQKVGFCLEPQQDVKAIEKWSLIQSYALQPVGRTFFTLRFQTANLVTKIVPLYRNLDKHSLKHLLAQTAFSLEGQIKGSTQLIQYTPQLQRNHITQLKLQQPLFEAADISLEGETNKTVRVLFGSRTANTHLSSENVSAAQTNAYHTTIQHIDPTTKLQIWRTYFLDSNIKTKTTLQMIQQQQKQTFLTLSKYVLRRQQETAFADHSLLVHSYLGLVQGVIDGIATISKDYRNLNKQFLTGHITSKVNLFLNSLYEGGDLFVKDNLQVYLQSYDSMGQPRTIDFKDSITFKLTSTFYVLKCRLNSIVSKQTGESLGSVCFSECFLLQQGCYLLLTKSTAYFDFWKTSQDHCALLDKLNPNVQFQQLGLCLSTQAFKNRLFVPLQRYSTIHFHLPVLNIRYYFHQKGLRLFSQKTGWHLLLYSDIIEATMVNKVPGQWVLFKTKSSLFFQTLQSNVLAVQFRGRAFEHLLKKVNDKTDPLPLSHLDAVPPLLAENWLFSSQILKKQVKQGALLHQHQILQTQFLWSFIQAKQLMVLNQMKDIKLTAFRSLYQQRLQRKFQVVAAGDKTSLIVVNGTYATGKYRLAQTLVKYGGTECSFSVFHIPYQHLFARMEISTFLEMLDQFVKDSEQKTNSVYVVVLPSWLNSAETIPALSQKYHIRSVVSKVSVGNFLASRNGNLTQNVLTFAVPGYTQSIVLDSNGQPQAAITAVTKVLWNFNKQARLLRSSNSMLSTGQCSDIIKDNLFSSQYHKFLRSKYGSLYRFDALSQLQVNYVQFKYPIFDLPQLRALSAGQGYLIDRKAIAEELKPKKIQAQNSKDQLMDSLYKIQQAITILKKQEKVPQIRCLKGVLQLPNDQKIQIVWANRDFRERVVPDNSKALGLFILSKNYDPYEVKQFLLKLTYRNYILQNVKPLRTEESLTEEERIHISKQGRNSYLQNGDFYDGYFYRDVEGHILPAHPSLVRLIREWLETTNGEIQRENKQLRGEWQQYCKKYE